MYIFFVKKYIFVHISFHRRKQGSLIDRMRVENLKLDDTSGDCTLNEMVRLRKVR